jgi:S-adenosylmethionine/arginine decarboxylase-like enzyme
MSHGRHIKVVGEADPDKLNSSENVKSFLADLVKRLGMTMLLEPVTCFVEVEIEKLGREPFEDEGGVTGICVLSTSHCSIHTWPARKFFVLDVYSCRDFEPWMVLQSLKDVFGLTGSKLTDLTESLRWP